MLPKLGLLLKEFATRADSFLQELTPVRKESEKKMTGLLPMKMCPIIFYSELS